MSARTNAELDQTYAVLSSLDPEMAQRFKTLVYPQRVIADLEKELHTLKGVHQYLQKRWLSSRDELHELRMSLVTLGFERRAPMPNLDEEFATWHAAFDLDATTDPGTRPKSILHALKIGYVAGRCADQYYKENPIAGSVHDICVRLFRKQHKKWWQFWRA